MMYGKPKALKSRINLFQSTLTLNLVLKASKKEETEEEDPIEALMTTTTLIEAECIMEQIHQVVVVDMEHHLKDHTQWELEATKLLVLLVKEIRHMELEKITQLNAKIELCW